MASMYQRFVQPGRLCYISYGPFEGKVCTVIDIVNQRRVIVDGPESQTGVPRHQIPVRWLSLTDFKCKILKAAREKTLKKALGEGETLKKWGESAWAKKIAART